MWWRRVRYLLALAALCSVATCPAAQRSCAARRAAREADDLLAYLADRVDVQVAATGRVPPLPAPLTPAAGCCEQGGTCQPDEALWTDPGWRALGFSIDAEFRFSYQYLPDESGKSAVLRAIGHLSCESAGTAYELRLTVDGDKVSRAWTRANPDD